MTDASGAQEGLDAVEQAAESAAQKTASSAAKAADNVVSETETAAKKVREKVKDAADQSEKETASAGTKIRKKSKETSEQVSADAEKAGKRTQTSAQETKEKVLAQFQAGQVAIGNLISQCVTKVLDAGKSLIQTGVAYNAQIEKYRVGLTNLLGSAEKANAALEAIQQDAARTPFDTASLVQANQLLIGAGENAEYSRKTILALGDAVSATGGGSAELERMAQNLQQIANVGKASSVDIKQFAMAGINIYQVLADYTGKSVQDVQSMTISYDVLTQALQAAAEEGGRYYNAMDTQSETLSGRLSTLKDNAAQLVGVMSEDLTAAVGEAVSELNTLAIAAKQGWELDGLNGMLDAVGKAKPALSGLTNAIQFCTQNANILLPLLGSVAGAILTYRTAATVATTAQAALNAVMNANPIGIVITLLGALAGAFGTAYASSETFRSVVSGAFTTVAENARKAMSTAISWLDKLSYKLNNALEKNGYTGYDSYEDWKADQTSGQSSGGRKQSTVTDADRKRRKNLHNSRVQQAKAEKAASGGYVESSLTSGSTGGTSSGKKGSTGTKTATERVVSSLQDAATTYSSNAYGTITTATTELTEHILDSNGKEYDRFTKTVTESGKELVNGVVKNYTLVTKAVTENGKTVTQTQKVYQNAADSIARTTTRVSEQTVAGVKTTTQKVTETAEDGSEHVKETVTETGERVVEGVRETYTITKTYLDGFLQDTKETCNEVETTITATQTRIDNALSGAKSELGKGIFGLVQSAVGNLKNKNWSGLALNAVQLIFGEIDQKQREALADWAEESLKAINETYAGGGLRNGLQAISDLFLKGITPAVNGSTAAVKSFAEVLDGLSKSGGIGGLLGVSGQKLLSLLTGFGAGMGSAATGIGAALSSAASGLTGILATVTTGIASAFATVGGLISANPVLAAVLAIGLGIVGLGAAIWAIYGRKKKSSEDEDPKPTSSVLEFTRGQNDVKRPAPGASGTYTPSETITAAELVRRTQAASAANQRSFTRTQSGTGTTASQKLNATLHGGLTATFNVDGQELARVTAPYFDEELAFLQ